jgi:hypothetical protein
MGSIILLAFGACVFPTLLACVAIIISRPEPRVLLMAFYAGGLVTSVSTGIAVLALFTNGDAVLGSTPSAPHPTTSIVAGVIAFLGAWAMASARGNAMLARWRSNHSHRRKPKWPIVGRAHAGPGVMEGGVLRWGDHRSARSVLSARAGRDRARRLQRGRAGRAHPALQRDHVPAVGGPARWLTWSGRTRPPGG